MKKKDIFLLAALLGLAIALILFSVDARSGAYQGLVLAENTIIPSLLPLLIIFMLIMKTGAKDVLSKCLGFICVYVFNLPKIALPAIFFGLIGGYPTGALLTRELFTNQEIDSKQAAALLRFNFCGGCGFIITAVGSTVLKNLSAGIILFTSNIISSIIIGFVMSLGKKRLCKDFYSFSECKSFSTALIDATDSAIKSVLNITAFVILFSAVNNVIRLPDFLLPLLEITNGICDDNTFTLPELSAYLAFGGICIHLQLMPIILKCGMKYIDFLTSRIISALLSYCITRLLTLIFPSSVQVFSNSGEHVAVFSSVNIALSLLLIIGCFVLILDVSSHKRYIDN